MKSKERRGKEEHLRKWFEKEREIRRGNREKRKSLVGRVEKREKERNIGEKEKEKKERDFERKEKMAFQFIVCLFEILIITTVMIIPLYY